jgi:hypothetical protein
MVGMPTISLQSCKTGPTSIDERHPLAPPPSFPPSLPPSLFFLCLPLFSSCSPWPPPSTASATTAATSQLRTAITTTPAVAVASLPSNRLDKIGNFLLECGAGRSNIRNGPGSCPAPGTCSSLQRHEAGRLLPGKVPLSVRGTGQFPLPLISPFLFPFSVCTSRVFVYYSSNCNPRELPEFSFFFFLRHPFGTWPGGRWRGGEEGRETERVGESDKRLKQSRRRRRHRRRSQDSDSEREGERAETGHRHSEREGEREQRRDIDTDNRQTETQK